MTNTSLQKFIPVLGVNCKTEEWDFEPYVINPNSKDFPHTAFDDCVHNLCTQDDPVYYERFHPSILDVIDGWSFHITKNGRPDISEEADIEAAQSQGIYFVQRSIPYNEGGDQAYETVYVGKTNNFLNRFNQHHKQKAFDLLGCYKIYFLRYNSDVFTEMDLLWAERQYINLLKPILNDCSASCLPDGNGEDVKNKIVDDFRLIYEQGYQQGVKDGFASAKNQMMDFFDSAIQMPNALK